MTTKEIVEIVTAGIRVLVTRDKVLISEAQIKERANNIAQALVLEMEENPEKNTRADELVKLARRICTLMTYDRTKKEIHDDVVRPGVSEEDFFLAYQAAGILLEQHYEKQDEK